MPNQRAGNGHVNLNHSRAGRYQRLLEKIERDGVCPFCSPYLKRYHRPPIIRRTAHWLLTTNQTPYRGLKHHWLLISRDHLNDIKDLTPDHWRELGRLLTWLTKKYRVPGGSLFIRFGDTDYTGGSVAHLHAHLVVGGRRRKNREINIRLAYKK
jgi:ATP adenylyltransferase